MNTASFVFFLTLVIVMFEQRLAAGLHRTLPLCNIVQFAAMTKMCEKAGKHFSWKQSSVLKLNIDRACRRQSLQPNRISSSVALLSHQHKTGSDWLAPSASPTQPRLDTLHQRSDRRSQRHYKDDKHSYCIDERNCVSSSGTSFRFAEQLSLFRDIGRESRLSDALQGEVSEVFTGSIGKNERKVPYQFRWETAWSQLLGWLPLNDASSIAPISDVHELRRRVLDEGIPFSTLKIHSTTESISAMPSSSSSSSAAMLSTLTPKGHKNANVFSHDIVKLLVQRYQDQSVPGRRPAHDTAKLALCIEGGGMRGAVSAGMTASIAALGLSNAFDVVYGSSAGAVVGSYFVTRQMCLDVYLEILPAAQQQFVCTKRMMSTLAVSTMDYFFRRIGEQMRRILHFTTLLQESTVSDYQQAGSWSIHPGMNISFVLDNVMSSDKGVRPLDLECFRKNIEHQQLKIVASYINAAGQLRTCAFGKDQFSLPEKERTNNRHPTLADRFCFFDCLRASMTVPGATNSPVHMLDPYRLVPKERTCPFFDAFCFEPLPYRSAVEDGATHCLVLCSRPADFVPSTKAGFYEKVVTPIYFKSHGQPSAASFFKKGGQQYIYAEDLLTLEEGKRAGIRDLFCEKFSVNNNDGRVAVPPPQALYGVDWNRDPVAAKLAKDREKWNRACLLPLKVPAGTAELRTLEQDPVAVLEAVRGGFAAGYDLLAPALGVTHHMNHLPGYKVAQLLFPDNVVPVS
jgi:hypothetical protein